MGRGVYGDHVQMKTNLLLAAIIIGILAAVYTFWPRDKAPVGVSVTLPPAKEVRTIEKIVYQPKLVYVYPDKSKSGLNLPESVITDTQKKLIATGKLDAEERPYTMSAILDEKGNAEIYARPDPLPWFGTGKRGEVGVAYGMREGEIMGRIYANQDLLQIKALRAGVGGTIDQDGQYFAGGYIRYQW